MHRAFGLTHINAQYEPAEEAIEWLSGKNLFAFFKEMIQTCSLPYSLKRQYAIVKHRES